MTKNYRSVLGKHVSKHPLYRVWSATKQRCYDAAHAEFNSVGGRGIGMCDEWRASVEAFAVWALSNGWEPGLYMVRRDRNGWFQPENVEFVTKREWVVRSRNATVLADGRLMLEAVAQAGASRDVVRTRVRNGWTLEAALAGPVGSRNPAANSKKGQGAFGQMIVEDGPAAGRRVCEVIDAEGLCVNVVRARWRSGWTLEAALAVPVGESNPARPRRGRAKGMLDDGRDPDALALANGVGRAAWRARVQDGWTILDAVTLPSGSKNPMAGPRVRKSVRGSLVLDDGRSAALVAAENGISDGTWYRRWKRFGWPLEDAVTVPVGVNRP